jgi:hypothetical protein
MAEETILSFNFANWVTVLIMVILGYAIVGMVARIIQQQKSTAAAA